MGLRWRVSSTGNKSGLGVADGDDPEDEMRLKVIVIIVHFSSSSAQRVTIV